MLCVCVCVCVRFSFLFFFKGEKGQRTSFTQLLFMTVSEGCEVAVACDVWHVFLDEHTARDGQSEREGERETDRQREGS